MNQKPYEFHDWRPSTERMHNNGEEIKNSDIIVASKDGEKNQVYYFEGNLYDWRYKETGHYWAAFDSIDWWRGCGGFDF